MGAPIEEIVADNILKLEASVHVLRGNLAPVITPGAKRELDIIREAAGKLHEIAAKLGLKTIILENIDALTKTIGRLNTDLYDDVGSGYATSGSFVKIGGSAGSGSTIIVNDTVDRQLHRVNNLLKELILENESTTREVRGVRYGVEKHLVEKYNKRCVPKGKTLVERYNQVPNKDGRGFTHMPE